MRLRRAVHLALALTAPPGAWAALVACGTDQHPPALADRPPPPASSGAAGDSGLTLDDADDAVPDGACGSEKIPAVTNPPNLSFIIDHSLSMGDSLTGSANNKYETARQALGHVLKAVGHRVNYGAAIFPGLAGKTGCEAGDELVKIGPGDPPSYTRAGRTGPHLRDLLDRLQIAGVDGGTPAAPTLLKMLDTLRKLSGDTFVVLITDGAPNCNLDLSCSASSCIPNIEGSTVAGLDCRTSVNCCAPSADNPNANSSCVDVDASLAAVRALRDANIRTFVVGMPGSEPYEQLLNQMAELGGTARSGASKYYPVEDTAALEQSLTAIAASVAISCDIPLDYEPPEPDLVNVYFDGTLVEYDPEAGWEWTDDGHVALRGAACDQLSAGDVLEVQVVAGCKTVVK
ncbi:MAG TPA: hypothetical protein VEQ58_14795 [Polyangiaceae bacterium]|nr:hypothetical protein [Polyangiaceae bacterium]